jgi:hypothetical protein
MKFIVYVLFINNFISSVYNIDDSDLENYKKALVSIKSRAEVPFIMDSEDVIKLYN